MAHILRRQIISTPNLASALVQYRHGARFDPQAEGEAYDPLTGLPVYQLNGAGGFPILDEIRIAQDPQVWFGQQISLSGFGGVRFGQFALQPLVDPAAAENI